LVNAHGADPAVGGTESYLARLGRRLPELGFDVSFLTGFVSGAPAPGPERVLYAGHWKNNAMIRMRVHLADLWSRPSRRLEEAMAWALPDVVHTYNLPGITTAIWEICRRRGVPVVHTLTDYYVLCPRVSLLRPDGRPCQPHPLLCGARTRRLTRWASAVSHVVSISRYAEAQHAGLFPRAEKHLILNPRDPPAARRLEPPGPTLRTLGYIGALERSKGVDQLLAATPRLASRGLRVRVAGSGRMRPQVEEAAARGLIDYVGVVSGSRRDDFIESCDLGVVASVWPEPGAPPFAMVEWLAGGRPVLASRRGGLAEALDATSGGIAIEPSADAIVAAVADLEDESRWSAAVRRVTVAPPAPAEDEWISAHEAIYRALVGSG
jgi:glycosyltransferase involved in cell wall biosynthesis